MPHKKTAITTAATLFTGLVTATVLTVGAGAVSAAPAATTQTFQARATSQPITVASGFVLADDDVTGTNVIGHDVLSCTLESTGSACDVAFAQAGGILDAHFKISDATGALTGTVDGGTGRFRHAHGTLKGNTLSRSTVQITLHYCL